MTSKNVLNISQPDYRRLLKRLLKHDCYINSFNTTRKVGENFLQEEPTIDDFTHDVETLNISLPFPISEAYEIENVVDHCNALVVKKQQYSNKLESFVERYKKDKKWLTKKYVKETKYGMLPKYVFDLSVENLKDPDVYFHGNYNWYYTGGVLDTCPILNEQYLIYADNKNLLCLTNNSGQDHLLDLEILEKTPIFNIRTNTEKKIIVSVRQKHQVCVFELQSVNDEFNCTTLTTQKSAKIPYIDLKYHNNEISTLKLDRQLHIQQLDSKVHDEYTFEDTAPSFRQIEYMDSNNIIAVDRKWIRIFDKRSKQEQMSVIKNNEFKCDELCTFALSNKTNSIFLASTHDILKVDLRQLNIVKKWSHMLSSPPSLIKVRNYDENELVFLSSQDYDDRVVLLSNEDESNLVQMVPNNTETVTKCNKIYNFNFYNDNMKRLEYNTVGMGILQSDEGMELYTCNSVGDLFKNTISREDNSSSEPLDKMNRWINAFPMKPKQLIISDVREMSHIKDILKKKVDTQVLNRYTKENKKRLDLLSEMTLEDVDMAGIWLTEEEPRQDLLPSTSSRVKVFDWLQQREEQSDDEANGDDDVDDNKETEIQYMK